MNYLTIIRVPRYISPTDTIVITVNDTRVSPDFYLNDKLLMEKLF